MKYYLILFTVFTILTTLSYWQNFTGANSTQLRILTDSKAYEFVSKNMDGRLNDALNRFEFKIPVSSFKSVNDSSDIWFLQRLTDGNEFISIYASLPDDKDAELDLSYFKGSKSTNLNGQIKLGSSLFEDDIDFNGILTNGNQSMAFNFNVFLNERELSFAKVNSEKILEIEITAKGDKIAGLTSN